MARTKLETADTPWSEISAAAPAQSGGSAAEEIAEQIQRLIVSQGLSEGDRIPSERELARLLSTSRPTVSQSIRILVTRGLVESRRGSGAYVTNRPLSTMGDGVRIMLDLNAASAVQLNDLRLWLETKGAEEAIAHADEEDIARSRRDLEELTDTVGDTAAWISADTRFHSMLVRASGNPYLADIYESVHGALINYEYREWIGGGEVPEWLREPQAETMAAVHRPILEAVAARDVEAARRAVLMHHEAMAAHLAQTERTA